MLPSIIFVKNTYTCVPVLLIGDFFKFQIDVGIYTGEKKIFTE